jgi:hypothetical protein
MVNDDIKVFTRRGNDWTKRFKTDAAVILVAVRLHSRTNVGCPKCGTPLYLGGACGDVHFLTA